MAGIKDVIETLDKAADGFESTVSKTQKKLYEDIIVLVKELDLDGLGKVKPSVANFKKLTAIKTKLSHLAKETEYSAGIGKFLQYFDVLQQEQNAYFTGAFPQSTVSTTAAEKHKLMKQIAVQNTIEALTGTGLKANVTDKINDILLRAVTSGAKFADLTSELKGFLEGEKGSQGALSRYATTYATTALSQFTGQNNKLLTQDINNEWFMYVGSTKETTREFCEHLVEKRYIHKSEIPTILKGEIDGHQCKIYEKTGLPLGMIEGTNAENFQVNCGGWNCRHQLVPVDELAVPQSVRDKIKNKYKQIKPTVEKKESDAFEKWMKSMRKIGWTDSDFEINDKVMRQMGVDANYREAGNVSEIDSLYTKAIETQLNRMHELNTLYIEIKNLTENVKSINKRHDEKVDGAIKEAESITRQDAYKMVELGGTYSEIQQKYQHALRILKRAMNKAVDVKSIPIKYDESEVDKISDSIGVRRMGRVVFSEAANGSINPGYDSDNYKTNTNCQRCVISFEYKLRGLDIITIEANRDAVDNKGKPDDSIWHLGVGGGICSNMWINDKTKKRPDVTYVHKSTLNDSIVEFGKATKENGRYVLYVSWKGEESAHVLNVIKTTQNRTIYCPQSNQVMDFKDLYNRSDIMAVYRVDDCSINPKIAIASMKPTEFLPRIDKLD